MYTPEQIPPRDVYLDPNPGLEAQYQSSGPDINVPHQSSSGGQIGQYRPSDAGSAPHPPGEVYYKPLSRESGPNEGPVVGGPHSGERSDRVSVPEHGIEGGQHRQSPPGGRQQDQPPIGAGPHQLPSEPAQVNEHHDVLHPNVSPSEQTLFAQWPPLSTRKPSSQTSAPAVKGSEVHIANLATQDPQAIKLAAALLQQSVAQGTELRSKVSMKLQSIMCYRERQYLLCTP